MLVLMNSGHEGGLEGALCRVLLEVVVLFARLAEEALCPRRRRGAAVELAPHAVEIRPLDAAVSPARGSEMGGKKKTVHWASACAPPHPQAGRRQAASWAAWSEPRKMCGNAAKFAGRGCEMAKISPAGAPCPPTPQVLILGGKFNRIPILWDLLLMIPIP